MKKLVVLLSLVVAVSAYSQGELGHIILNNKVSSVNLNAPITYKATAGNPRNDTLDTKINGAGTLVTGAFDWGGQFARVGLYGGPVGTAEADLVLLTPIVTLRTGSAAGYTYAGALASDADRAIPGTVPGGSGVFQLRAWDTGSLTGNGSYETAIQQSQYYAGKSGMFTITGLGGGTFQTPYLGANTGIAGESGLTPFSIIYVPEPSIIGLGILGAVAGLFVFRRRN